MSKEILRPKNNLKIRNPQTKQFLSNGGELVEITPYWKRRIKDGDVEVVKSSKKEKTSLQGDK